MAIFRCFLGAAETIVGWLLCCDVGSALYYVIQ